MKAPRALAGRGHSPPASGTDHPEQWLTAAARGGRTAHRARRAPGRPSPAPP